ncbi:Uncharacterised protein [BD1-7 clade bacterium]|uniref:Uncharacterized protein n=1 Tax=BD1-7 clade bacterium TaxID=2029982 RepID=A0A5S9PX64_9GAMM|nr:Uncharacterised protein [BD1-7 clade bacterium]CAA0113141.1 Uncharacterised protein [BD1-7 clade bacterium]
MLPNLKKWAFFYFSPGFSPSTHTSISENEHCTFISVGFDPSAKNDDSIVETATRLANDGVQTIELCGGFGPEWVVKIENAMSKNVPIGSVTYGPKYRASLLEIMKP